MRVEMRNGKVHIDFSGYSDYFYTHQNFNEYTEGIYDKNGDVIFYDTDSDIFRLDNLIRTANFSYIPVDQEVIDYMQVLYARQRERNAILEAKRLQEEKEMTWRRKKASGCGLCHYCQVDGDDMYCTYTEKLLDLKNVPSIVNGVHYCFNFEPMPCDGCFYQVENNNKGDIQNEHFSQTCESEKNAEREWFATEW